MIKQIVTSFKWSEDWFPPWQFLPKCNVVSDGRMQVVGDDEKMRAFKNLEDIMKNQGISEEKIQKALNDPRAEERILRNRSAIEKNHRMSMMPKPPTKPPASARGRPSIVHHVKPIENQPQQSDMHRHWASGLVTIWIFKLLNFSSLGRGSHCRVILHRGGKM